MFHLSTVIACQRLRIFHPDCTRMQNFVAVVSTMDLELLLRLLESSSSGSSSAEEEQLEQSFVLLKHCAAILNEVYIIHSYFTRRIMVAQPECATWALLKSAACVTKKMCTDVCQYSGTHVTVTAFVTTVRFVHRLLKFWPRRNIEWKFFSFFQHCT